MERGEVIRTRPTRTFWLVISLLVLIIVGGNIAHAQNLIISASERPSTTLTAEDAEYALFAEGFALTQADERVYVMWGNRASGNSGSVFWNHPHQMEGQDCRNYYITVDGKFSYLHFACDAGNRAWKVQDTWVISTQVTARSSNCLTLAVEAEVEGGTTTIVKQACQMSSNIWMVQQ